MQRHHSGADARLAAEDRRTTCSNLQSDQVEPYVQRTYEVSGRMGAAVRSVRATLVAEGWSQHMDRSAAGRTTFTYRKRFDGFTAQVHTRAYGPDSVFEERAGELVVTARIVSPSFCAAPG